MKSMSKIMYGKRSLKKDFSESQYLKVTYGTVKQIKKDECPSHSESLLIS